MDFDTQARTVSMHNGVTESDRAASVEIVDILIFGYCYPASVTVAFGARRRSRVFAGARL
jgi:hypothetical protein